MLEYDFLKILNDYVWIYKEFLLPVVICDPGLKVYWSNAAAKSLYPNLADTRGLKNALGEFDSADLLDRVKRDGTLVIDGVAAFSETRLNLMPMTHSGEVVGFIIVVVEGGSSKTPAEIVLSSKTTVSLEASIRQSVEQIFRTMDDTALKADMLGAGWIKPSLDDIAQSSYFLLRIAGNISTYSQLTSQFSELSPRPADLFGLIRRLEPAVSGLAAGMEIPVRFELPDSESAVKIDADKLQLAFFNLLHNSLYFTRPGNEITITGASSDNAVRITVSDKGAGIPAKILPRVFTPYFSYGHGGKSTGLGLGLAIAKLVAEAHRGSLEITSSEGEGTSASIIIPRSRFLESIPLAQGNAANMDADRFSRLYVGLADAARSPYRGQQLV